MFGNVNIRLRPIKIAFLVDPKDKKAILDAIAVNSFLWGGVYNPIIPVVRRIPNTWKKADPLIGHRSSAQSITEGYIDAYDPDFFVVVGKCDAGFLNLDKEQTITTTDILKNVEHDGTPGYGVGLFELLRHLIETELKFVRRTPLQLRFPDLDGKFDLFLASVAGKLPDNIEAHIRDNYGEYIDSTDMLP